MKVNSSERCWIKIPRALLKSILDFLLIAFTTLSFKKSAVVERRRLLINLSLKSSQSNTPELFIEFPSLLVSALLYKGTDSSSSSSGISDIVFLKMFTFLSPYSIY